MTTRIGTSKESAALTALIDSKNRPVVAGAARDGLGPAVVVRYKRNGERDGSFGHDGIVRLRLERGRATALVKRPDGGAFVAGSFNPVVDGRRAVTAFVAKLDSDGALVRGFGEDGVKRLPALKPKHLRDHVRLIESPDRALIGAYAGKDGIRITGIKLDGRIERAFGDEGSLELPYRSREAAEDVGGLIVDRSGMITASTCEQHGVNAIRFTDKGRLDTSFGADGTVSFDPPGEPLYVGCTLAPTAGEGLIGGPTGVQGIEGNATSLIELDRQGGLESNFGDGGVLRMGRKRLTGMAAVEVLHDGRIAIAATRGRAFAKRRFVELVLKSSGTPDKSSGRGGKIEVPFQLGPSEPAAIDIRGRTALLAGFAGYHSRSRRSDGRQLIGVAVLRN